MSIQSFTVQLQVTMDRTVIQLEIPLPNIGTLRLICVHPICVHAMTAIAADKLVKNILTGLRIERVKVKIKPGFVLVNIFCFS